jgi:capsid protein
MSALSLSNLIYGGGYATGAATITQGKPQIDGNIDIKDAVFPRRMREQINWLNVNEPDIPAIVSSTEAKVIGVKINVQVESKFAEFNSQAESLIEDFCGMEYMNGETRAVGELTGVHHFNSSARAMAAFTVLNGGFLIRHHYNPEWRIPYKYELVGVDMIDISKTDRLNIPAGATTSTVNGLVRNQYGQITDVWIYSTISKTKSEKVPYNQLTYFHEVWVSIDQLTAISKLTSILNRLDMSTQYGIAELEAAIEEAKAGHFIESSAYSELMKIVGEEISKATANKTGSDRIGAVRDLVSPILKDLSNLGIKNRGTTPIPQGDKVQFNTTKRDSIYNDMNANSDMKIASSQGMSDIGIFSKASEANYSAIKFVSETDQLHADTVSDNLEYKAFFSIFARLVEVGVQIGRINVMRASFWKNPNNFFYFRYLRKNKIDIEPLKNASANAANIALGIRTEGQIVEESQGMKYETFLRNKQEDSKLRIQYDIELEQFRLNAYTKAGITPPNTTGATNA